MQKTAFLKILTVATVLFLLFFLANLMVESGQIPDNQDILGYFNSTNWVFGTGTLYKDVLSEYPLLANLVFSLVRLLTFNLNQSPLTFALIWVGFNSILFSGVVISILELNKEDSVSNELLTLFAWLMPSTIFFALLRYDIYPATTTLIMMWSLRNEKWLLASIWLGITIALKGYAIFLLPTLFVYLLYRESLKQAIISTVISLMPFTFGIIIIFFFAGIDGAIYPIKFHAIREINSDSSYQIIRYYLIPNLRVIDLYGTPFLFQIFTAILGAYFRPKNFQELVNSLAFVILGFVTFSIFYSPQFLMWFLPILCFSSSQKIRQAVFLYALTTMGYLIFLANPTFLIFKSLITGLTVLRFYLMWLLYWNIRKGRISDSAEVVK